MDQAAKLHTTSDRCSTPGPVLAGSYENQGVCVDLWAKKLERPAAQYNRRKDENWQLSVALRLREAVN